MKARLNQAIDVAVKPSPLLLGSLIVISIVSSMVVITLPIALFYKLLMVTIILFSTSYYTLRDGLLLLPWSWQRVQVSSLGQLRLTNNQGQQFTPDLAAASFIHPYLIILNLKKPVLKQRLLGLALPAVILFAAPRCQQHRALRVWLRWWRHEKEIDFRS
jgi:hypothetical protein